VKNRAAKNPAFHLILREAISKIGFWLKITAEPSFPAERDFPPDPIIFVGRKLLLRLRRIEDLKRDTNKDMGPKDISEMGYSYF
jgi:hypothetical protein